ncbi:NUDIX hydrolase [Corynebacterium alimapuense]|uniref:NUDIX hydrolase n=1 Tax=Corynebacterium alimapuense TaxID=1576874 RepID=A0A3M8K735_9CORY|nr:NUDIX domain-containing protein [Corynebacterium alimapuense]RNE48382.1 NUDIX hydrolase [Corynebacterium alimapuense]
MPLPGAPLGHGQARLSTTVILVRDHAETLQVWAQERVSTMRNYPGMTVFPGGGVDRRDCPTGQWDPAALWTGAPLQEMSDRLEMTDEQTHAVVFAAVRELFEETGILLAVHEDGSSIEDVSPYQQDREDLISHRISLTDMLSNRGLRVRSDLLHPWARWVGGWREHHWFDTVSFLAVTPPGQGPDGDTSEADDAGWFTPALLLEGWKHGLVRLAIPTWAQMRFLAQFSTSADAIAAASAADLTPVVGDPIDDPRYQEYFTARPIDRI